MAEKPKQLNFRVSQDQIDIFNEFCQKLGVSNQAAGFDRMIEVVEMMQAKESVPSREAEIAEFERCLNHLQRAYLISLELNQQAETRVREEFARDLERDKEIMDDRRDQILALKEEIKGFAGVTEKVKQLQADLEAAQEQARKDRMDVEDRNLTIKQLTGTNEILQIKGDAYDNLKADRDALAEQLRDANATIKDLKKDHILELERAARTAEKAQEKAIAAVIVDCEAKISKLREQLQEAQIKAAEDLRAAERLAHEVDRASAAEIRKLEQANAQLRESLAKLVGRQE